MDNVGRQDKNLIQVGDTCVLYISESQKSIIKVEDKLVVQTKFGQLQAMDLVGHPYGVQYDCKRGWILPLRLTPELWTQLLPHRTQILYQADISMILLQLDIKPGTIVIESGTGSGSLSHNILRAIRPSGYLYTFDIDESRVKQAQEEFVSHNYGDFVTVSNRNVCEQGFGEDLNEKADACLLDLPQTWDAIEHAYRALKPYGSRLCTFSPCIEQVKQNVVKMTELNMRDIMTMEVLIRPYEVREQNLRLWDEDILEKLVDVDKRRFENLKNSSRGENTDTKMQCNNETPTKPQNNLTEIDSVRKDTLALERALSDPKAPFHSRMLPKTSQVYIKPFNESVSHSGYLTFATKRL